MATSASTSPVQRFDGFEVDPRARELRRKGIRIRIQDQPLEVLLLLLEHRGEVVTREELKQRLWPAGTYVDAEDGLNTAIRKLREHLGDSAERPVYIETIPRRGYRFIANSKEQASATPDLAIDGTVAAATLVPTTVEATREMAKVRRPWQVIAIAGLGLFAIVAVTTWVLRYRKVVTPSARPAISSIAVLPLENLSGDPAQNYFADGITEELIGRLSMIRGLRVISRTSSKQFRNSHLTAPEIARALNVDALVEGSVIRQGDRVRVHAQLIRAATDEHFWSENYDREMQDALTLESEAAQAIAQRVEVTVTGEERARLGTTRSVAPEVYENYLKGLRLVTDRKADLEESVGFFREAIRRDPSFAPAYVGLAQAYVELGTNFVGVPAAETRPKVIENARMALELDPHLAEAHVQLANVYRKLWRWDESEAEDKRALELAPNSADALGEYAEWLLCHGRFDEALVLVRHAREVDPVGTQSDHVGWILFQARKYDEALREMRSAVSLEPEHAYIRFQLSFVLIAMNHPDEAIPHMEKALALTDRSPGSIELLATAYAKAGRRSDALRLLDELKHRRKTGYVPAGSFVFGTLALGDREQALLWLTRACDEKSNLVQYLKVHPLFDPIRDDPRFAQLLRRVGLDR